MSVPHVEVVAPSRLHFGMFSFGHADTRQFGGAGAMVDRPGLKLRISPADQFTAHGPSTGRVQTIVERLACRWRASELPACRVEVVEAPAEHVGLGTGTQLALSLAAGLNAFRGGPPLEAHQLAALTGRAARSAIGTYGFLHGGFLVESGKRADEDLSPLEHRAPLPASWRFVLICLAGQHGLSGEAEQTAFRDLPPVAPDTTRQLRHIVNDELVPAAAEGDFARFSRGVYRFGYRAGMCFSARQGGAFASPRIAQLVETVRGLGVEGVGQSSWGPTVFALLECDDSAKRFAAAINKSLNNQDTLIVAEPNASGARITLGT
jgi:beta-ribofuranosylaminobenzene 5'-phosphate synthase